MLHRRLPVRRRPDPQSHGWSHPIAEDDGEIEARPLLAEGPSARPPREFRSAVSDGRDSGRNESRARRSLAADRAARAPAPGREPRKLSISDIVAADQECVARQVYDTMSDASEVRDRQTLHFHRVQPLLMPVYSPCSGNLRGKTPAKPYPPPSNPPILAIEVGDLGSGRPPASFRRTLTAALA